MNTVKRSNNVQVGDHLQNGIVLRKSKTQILLKKLPNIIPTEISTTGSITILASQPPFCAIVTTAIIILSVGFVCHISHLCLNLLPLSLSLQEVEVRIFLLRFFASLINTCESISSSV